MRSRFLGLSVLAIALVACSGGAATQAPTVAPTSAPTTEVTDAPASPATGSGDVQLADSDLGQIVVDADGLTLYGFVPDESTGEPTCYDDCATAWPPFLGGEDIVVGEGLDETEFTTAARTDDAGDQVVFGIYPLYYFADDSAPGDVNGQGLGDNWFVIGADGELIRE